MRPAIWAFVDDLDELGLADSDSHHLGRVLRLRDGEALAACDGAGRWRRCVAATVRGGDVRLEADGPVVEEPEPVPRITVGFSLVKAERPELIVQKLTELGVDRILPLAAARSIVRWDAKGAAQGLARLRRVARGAAMQARRARLPEVAPATTVAAAAAALGSAGALCQQGGDEMLTLRRPALLVGPEGGWDPGELETGLPTVDLGPTTLRAETAAIAAAVLLSALRSSTVREEVGRFTPSE